ncbi:MAG TPA: NAD(P)H-hydrate dehydratase [Anaerolineae bacterium]|nr:NAD(P)H-hydrate dehydratase [Anaerolineae bacterium]
MKLFTIAEMIAAESAANTAGHSYAAMMELAGHAVAQAIQARYPVADQLIFILVGPGNNGGDGLVAGRYLAQAGASVVCYLLQPRLASADANFAKISQTGATIIFAADDPERQQLHEQIANSNIIIDALLGTGVTRPIKGTFANLLSHVADGIAARNQQPISPNHPITQSLTPNFPPSHPPAKTAVIAVDCPSGLNCDTGALDPLAISADLTITFAGAKHGHFLFPAAAACGEVVVADIGIAPAIVADIPTNVATLTEVAALLPARALDGHKGTFGTALIVGGSADYLGAPILSARAALRTGCGLVALAVPRAVRQLAATHLPEATFPAMPDAETFSSAAIEPLSQQFARAAALLVGPGIGLDSAEFLTTLFAYPNLPPLVIDADALNYLAQQRKWWQHLPPNSILTPHPAEMGRLVGRDIRTEPRITLALTMAQSWGHIVVLKGAFTVIASPTGQASVIPIATPALAIAGSGDVLAGTIVSLLAQKLSPYDAARAAAYIHAAAGLHLAQTKGNRGHLASEIAETIPFICDYLDSVG